MSASCSILIDEDGLDNTGVGGIILLWDGGSIGMPFMLCADATTALGWPASRK